MVQSLLRLPGSDRCDDGGQLQADAGDPWMLGGGLSQKLKTYVKTCLLPSEIIPGIAFSGSFLINCVQETYFFLFFFLRTRFLMN